LPQACGPVKTDRLFGGKRIGGGGSVLEHKTRREVLDEAAAQGGGWIKVRLTM